MVESKVINIVQGGDRKKQDVKRFFVSNFRVTMKEVKS